MVTARPHRVVDREPVAYLAAGTRGGGPVIVRTRHSSSHLARNLFGDPAERDLYVYLPPGYEASGRRYATAYLLHAFGQDAGDARPSAHRPSALVAAAGGRPRPGLRPDGGPAHDRGRPERRTADGDAASGWTRPPAARSGRYVADDVVAHVDANYRTLPSAAEPGRARLLVGRCRGLEHGVDPTRRVRCHRGAVRRQLPRPDPPVDALRVSTTASGPTPRTGRSRATTCRCSIYAYAAAYSPNPERPPYFVDLPVDWPSGELLTDVWDRWLAHDPVVNWRHRVDNLRQLSGILLDAGVNDEHELQWGHRLLSHRLVRGRGRPRDHRERGKPRWSFPGAPTAGPRVARRGPRARVSRSSERTQRAGEIPSGDVP